MKSLAMPDLGAYNPRAQSRGWGRLADVVVGIGLVGALIAAVFGLLDLSHLARGTPARRIGLVNKGLSSSPCPCRGGDRDHRRMERPQSTTEPTS